MSNLKFIQVGDSFNAIGLNVVWVIIGLITIYAGIKNLLDKENLVLFRYRLWIWFMAPGKGFWCACSDHVPAANLQESKNRKNR